MILYSFEPEHDPAPLSAWAGMVSPGGFRVNGERVVWLRQAALQEVEEGPITKIEVGLGLDELTAPQLQEVAVQLGVKTRARKKASLVKVLSAHLEGLDA